MIIYFQFPIADIRLFLELQTGKLSLPLWPAPTPYNEFMRSFGHVMPRKKGGVSGWIGENEVCDAHRTMHFPKPIVLNNGHTQVSIRIPCVAKYFYSDGLGLGKFEFAFITKPQLDNLSFENILDIVKIILHSPVEVHSSDITPVQTKFYHASKYLARLYLYSTTRTDFHPNIPGKQWVFCGPPVMFIINDDHEQITASKRAENVSFLKDGSMELQHYWFNGEDTYIRLWLLNLRQRSEMIGQISLQLRLYILRLHAEYEALKLILKQIDNDRIPLIRGSDGFDNLQFYLNRTIGNILSTNHKIEKQFKEGDIEHLAYLAFEIINPGQREALLQKLQLSKMKPRVLDKAEFILDPETKNRRDLINIKKRRLVILEGQMAQYGLSCPPHIIIEVEDLRKEIEVLQLY